MGQKQPPHHSFFKMAFVLLALSLSLSAHAELKLFISKENQVGQFLVDGAASYSPSSGLLSVNIFSGQTAAGGDNPLFCFDYSTETASLAVELNSATSTEAQSLLVPELALASAVQYQAAASSIQITPASQAACFFRAYDATNGQWQTDFGLYGQAPSSGGAPVQLDSVAAVGEIFKDSFEGVVALDVALSAATAGQDDTVIYTITATNNSSFAVSGLSLQQSIPYGVSAVVDNCTVGGQASADVCVDASEDTLRYFNFSLEAGQSLELAISALRNADWSLGSAPQAVPIYVAFLASTADGIIFDVDQASITPP